MTIQDMTKYKGCFDVWESGVYVVTVGVVRIAVSAVSLVSQWNESLK